MVLRVYRNVQAEVDKMLHYKWWDKGRERSNRAKSMMDGGVVMRRCLFKHNRKAYSGPPDDQVRCYVCLDCHAAASEFEIIDRGFEFSTIPDWEINTIMDLDLERQNGANAKFFGMYSGR